MTLSSANKSVLSPLEFLTRSVAVYPDKTAVVYGERRYTYKEFGQRVNCLAAILGGSWRG